MMMESSPASAERSPISRTPSLLRVSISVDAAQVEFAVAAWELAGVHNSSVEYLLAEPTEEPWPGHDNHTERAEVVGYLTVDQWCEIESALRASAAQLLTEERTLSVEQLPVRDWRTAWHEHFDLIRVPGPRTIIVRPPHIQYESNPDEIVVELVPGLAFGTGQHQSTRLCLGLLAEYIGGGERVLDVGTGSGILAVAAAKLGAASVIATDIDPVAVDAARQTVRQNRLSDRVDVVEGSVPSAERFDVVVANLTADLLQYLAQDLASALRPGGSVLASGLIAARRDEVVSTLEACGLRCQADRSEDEWRALALCSRSPGELPRSG